MLQLECILASKESQLTFWVQGLNTLKNLNFVYFVWQDPIIYTDFCVKSEQEKIGQ